jgi:rare lipoprotein A
MLKKMVLLTLMVFGVLCSAETKGLASWYGKREQGKLTASGTRFDRNEYTCASRTYPMGTWLIVRFHKRRVLVKVTDRGPWVKGRILDLSERAAKDLGLRPYGVATVEIRTLNEIMEECLENRN